MTNDLIEANTIATAVEEQTSELRSWIDENTGRRVWQMTDSPTGAALSYFRNYRHLPDGRMLINVRGERGTGVFGGRLAALDPDSGALEILEHPGRYLKLRLSDGQAWFLKRPPGMKCRLAG